MALIHADNFTIYGTDTTFMLNGVYAEVEGITLVPDPDGVSSGTVALNIPPGAFFDSILRFASQNGAQSTVGAALRLWMPVLPNSSSKQILPIEISDNTNTLIASLKVMTNGQLQLLNALGAQIAISAVPVVTANGWYHIEVKFIQSGGGTSTCEVRVEGATVITSTTLNFNNLNNIAQVIIRGDADSTGALAVFYVKDFVVWDGTGSLNNNFMGSVLVTNLTPIADASLNWTPSTGATGWQIVDNIPPNDAQFISAPTPAPSPYKATLSDLPVTSTSVKGLVTFVRARKSDGGDGSMQVGIVSDPLGTPATVLGANRPITVAQTYWRDVFEVDPKTSAAWTPAAVNLAQLQINRTV